RDPPGDRGDPPAGLLRPRAGEPSLVPRPLDLPRDSLVLPGQQPQEVELLERVAEARSGKDDLERPGLARLVQPDEPPVEPDDRDPVLRAKEPEPLGLEPEELVQAHEPPLVEVEVPQEGLEPRLHDSDLALEPADLRRVAGDLVAQRALACRERRDARLDTRQLRVHRLLLGVRVRA